MTCLFLGIQASVAQTALDTYLAEGLKNNIVMQQKNIGLDKALLSLKIANGMFTPTVGLQGSYTNGVGGRNISIPVGDMLNPVYNTLNKLTDSNQFPQIQNVSQNFFPHNFYDAKLHTTLPIVNSDLLYNKKIRQQQVMLQEFEVDIYKRELIRNIKVAYFGYLSAREAVNIYKSALVRSQEGKRVNESLLSNGKGLAAYILRSQSEIETLNAQITDAENQVHNAQLYFNFLLNRGSEEPIVSEYNSQAELDVVALTLGQEASAQNREELKQVREAASLSQTVLKMNKHFWTPRLNGFVDLGSQQSDWKFNNQSRYSLVGVQLDIPLFAGFTNRNKIGLARLDAQSSELNTTLTSQQLNMSANIARNALETAHQSYRSSLKQLEAAQSYQRLIDKGYREGVNTFIEAVDARNQLTGAQLLVTINQYRVLSANANMERETATYELSKN
jgi:outer membrane protein TolC